MPGRLPNLKICPVLGFTSPGLIAKRHRRRRRLAHLGRHEVPADRVEHREQEGPGARAEEPVDESPPARSRLERGLGHQVSPLCVGDGPAPVDLADLDDEARDERDDDHQRHAEPRLAEAQLLQRARAARVAFSRDRRGPAGPPASRRRPSNAWTAVRALTRLSRAPLRSNCPWLTSMPARSALSEDRVGPVGRGGERIDECPHLDGALAALVVRRVAGRADGLVAEAEHRVARVLDRVVLVAGRAPRRAHLGEGLGVDALLEELGHHGVALAADVADPRDPRWRGPVVAVAVVARRRGQVALDRPSPCRERSSCTSRADRSGSCSRPCISRRRGSARTSRRRAADGRSTVGSDGGRMEWAGWQLTQTATLGSLSSRSRRPWTEVAYSATWSTRSAGLYRFMNCASEWQRPQSCGICSRRGLPMIPLGGVHRLHALFAGIAPVAGHAAEPLGLVDVVGERLRWRHEAIVAGLEVTGGAVVLRRLGGPGGGPSKEREGDHERLQPRERRHGVGGRPIIRFPSRSATRRGRLSPERLQQRDEVRHLLLA